MSWENELVQKYKLNPVCGFRCPSGWEKLVSDLFEDLSKMEGWNPKAIDQIKEKFGGLRVYISDGTDEMFERISKAEIESYKVCEACGVPAHAKTINNWVRAMCDQCESNFLKARRDY